MLQLRRGADRGRTTADGFAIDCRHSFSFGAYQDPDRPAYRALCMLNDHRVTPQSGFPRRRDEDVEILSYVLEGALEYEDSLGTARVLRPGAIHLLCAGTGVVHSRHNGSHTERVHFLEIGIAPRVHGLRPSAEERVFDRDLARREPVVLASPDRDRGGVLVHQDAVLFTSQVAGGEAHRLPVADDRYVYVHLASGRARVNGQLLDDGDAVTISGEPEILIEGLDAGNDVLIFDLA